MATSENTPVSSSITIEQHGRVGSSGTAKSGENMDYVSQENKNVSLDDIGSEKSEVSCSEIRRNPCSFLITSI